MSLTFGSLFAGIGGIDLGLEQAGMSCRWQIEIDEYCQQVLNYHWPNVPKYGDVKKIGGKELEPVDLIGGGFPCQPISRAGKRKATNDERWLWPHFARIIRVLRPRFVFVENVPELLDPWRDDEGLWNSAPVEEIFADLETFGYHAEWECLPASAFGAPHQRDRVFIVAHTNGEQLWNESVSKCWCESASVFTNDGTFGHGSDTNDPGRQTKDQVDKTIGGVRTQSPRMGSDSHWSTRWLSEPPVFGVDDGIPYRLVRDANTAYGNSVVVPVIEWIGRRIMSVVEQDK